ncbi:hypothetical protein BSKO_03835 [Bryopsis sp. KO-2023]|nr:hypothetical protein BSKO_03835 [Bryopsis sp. KO-2023]
MQSIRLTSATVLSHHRREGPLAPKSNSVRRGGVERIGRIENGWARCCNNAVTEPITLQSRDGEDMQGEFLDWKFGSRIHYVAAGEQGPPILMVHGFGAGSFHFTENIAELSKDHQVWALDLLGQGRSWPGRDEDYPEELCLSIDTWTEQLYDFVQELIKEPVILMGNSLGGYLAVSFASKHPTLCRGLVLLNATPFWGFGPRPDVDKVWSSIWPYKGTVPAPKGLKKWIEGMWWRRLRNPGNIRALLNLVYSSPVKDQVLIDQIVEATLHPTALDAFASIVFAPRAEFGFNEMLRKIQCSVCMIYGRDDPWVLPLWGQRLKRIVPDAMYYEVTPAGHCPHHERPGSVNSIASQWITAIESGTFPPHEIGDNWEDVSEDGTVVTTTLVDGKPRTCVERFDVLVERLWKWFSRL